MDNTELKKMIQEEIKGAQKEKSEVKEEKKESKIEATANMDELVEQLGNKFAEALKEQKGGTDKDVEEQKEKLFSTESGLKAIRYPSVSQVKDLSDDEKIVTFFKALRYHQVDDDANRVLKALTEGVNADGGYLVPEPLAARLWEILPDISVMRKLASPIVMTSQTLKLNSRTTHPKAYWIGEKQSKTTTSAELDQVTLTANKLVCRIEMTDELVADANVGIVNLMTEWFARAIGIEEDNAFFTGTGAGQPRGISIETIANQSVGASVDFDDVIDLMDLIPQDSKRNGAFIANAEALRLLRKVKDSNNAYIWRQGLGRNSGQTEALPDSIYGHPVYEQNDLSGDEIYFGDWSKYIIGDRQQITVETTRTGADTWVDDTMEIKAVERVDGRAVMVGAFAKLTNV